MRRHARKCAAAAAIVLSLVLTAFCGSPSGEKSGGSGPKREAPDVTVNDLDGRAVRLADYTGKVRIIDFWATWCAPCREEIPHFKELYQKYGDKGFVLIAISMDEEGM